MRKLKKKLKKPRRPWDKERIEKEKELLRKYGLRRKREIWKTESILRNFRRRARDLAAKRDEKGEKVLLTKLYRMGVLQKKDSELSDVLGLTIEDFLRRRLQTLVFEKNLANTMKHTRQLITHGHIGVDKRRILYPSYLVPRELENKISYYGKPPIMEKTKKEARVEPSESTGE